MPKICEQCQLARIQFDASVTSASGVVAAEIHKERTLLGCISRVGGQAVVPRDDMQQPCSAKND